MTETVLALVPDYGLWLIFVVVTLACLAVPLPASMLVLTAGGFTATGDLSLTTVVPTSVAAFIIGDQIAYALARGMGPKLLGVVRRSVRMAPVLHKSETMLRERGTAAVLLSHTILSPTCPYISYLCGAGGLSWKRFAIAAVPGAMIWTLAYVSLGYVFAAQLEQVADVLSNFFGVVLALAVAVGALILLKHRWDASHPDHQTHKKT